MPKYKRIRTFYRKYITIYVLEYNFAFERKSFLRSWKWCFPAKQRKHGSLRRIRDPPSCASHIWFEISLRSSDRHNPGHVDRRRSIILPFPRTYACAYIWREAGRESVSVRQSLDPSIGNSPIGGPIVSRVTGVYRGEAARFLFSARISAFSAPSFAIFRIYATRFRHRSARASYRLAGFRPRRTSPPLALSSSCESRVPRVSRDRIQCTTRGTARVKPWEYKIEPTSISFLPLSLSLLYSSIFVRDLLNYLTNRSYEDLNLQRISNPPFVFLSLALERRVKQSHSTELHLMLSM